MTTYIQNNGFQYTDECLVTSPETLRSLFCAGYVLQRLDLSYLTHHHHLDGGNTITR